MIPHLIAFVRDGGGLTPAESWAAIGLACVAQAIMVVALWIALNAWEEYRQGERL